MESNRINNIGWRRHPYGKSKDLYEIIKWYPNKYYGKLAEYLESGWEISFSGEFVRKGNCSIDKNFFYGNPESCYVLAWIKKDKEGYYLESVGSRPIELTDHELQDFITVWKQADKKLNKKQDEKA